jgi:valine dehydrogenase (NAD+)
VFQGMRAAAEHLWGSSSLAGKRVGIEGVGKVGSKLADHLAEAGAELVICDVSPGAVERTAARHPGVTTVADRHALVASQIDILAPCALGGTLDDEAVRTMTAKIVCGGANNQLAHSGIEKLLADRGVLYAPDYVVNSGGVIQVADELRGFNFERAKGRAEKIFDTTRKIFSIADKDGVPPVEAADRLAGRRISEVGRLRSIWLPA